MHSIHLQFKPKTRFLSWLIGLLLAVLTLAVNLSIQLTSLQNSYATEISDTLPTQFEQQMQDHYQTLRNLGFLYKNSQNPLNQTQFEQLTQAHFSAYPGIDCIGFAEIKDALTHLNALTPNWIDQLHALDHDHELNIKLLVPPGDGNRSQMHHDLSGLLKTTLPTQMSAFPGLLTQIFLTPKGPKKFLLYPVHHPDKTTSSQPDGGMFFMCIDIADWLRHTLNLDPAFAPSKIDILIENQPQIVIEQTEKSTFSYRNQYTLKQTGALKNDQAPYQIFFTIDWNLSHVQWTPILISLMLMFLVYFFILSLLQTIKRHTETLKINEQRFYQYFKNSHEAIIVTDPEGNIIYWNPMAEKIFGYGHKSVLHKPLSTVLLSKELRSANFFEKAIHATEDHFEAALVGKNLEPIFCTILVTKFVYNQKSEYALFIEDITQKKSDEAEIQKLAFYDPLTGLENRAYFTNTVNQYIEQLPGEKAALLFIDLDGFKEINDTQGHEFGDELLKIIALRLKNSIRSADEHAHLCRFGGDEFLILLGNITEKGAFLATERILSQLKRSIKVHQDELHISASVGVAFYPDHGQDLSTLLRHADTAMYEAKNMGKNTYAVYNHALEASLSERIDIERSLRKAIENNEFELYYQPQIDTKTLQPTALEALIRWQHPTLGFVSPETFISVAENSGQIIEIGNWVLETAVNQLKAWQTTAYANLPIAINVSSQQMEKSNFIEQMHQTMESAGLSYDLLEIELTERSIMSNATDNIELFRRIREKGFAISVDDFGTGYSSLSYLKRFPLNALKVDKSFVDGLPYDEEDISISKAIINLSHSLSMKVIAEGVESEAQLRFLTEAGCDMVQGYYFSRPLPVDALEKWLDEFKPSPEPTYESD